MPLRRTNRMPLRTARSGRRGRPPLGFGFGGVKRGSITSHKPSGSRAVRIAVHLHPVLLSNLLVARRDIYVRTRRFCRTAWQRRWRASCPPRKAAWLGHNEHCDQRRSWNRSAHSQAKQIVHSGGDVLYGVGDQEHVVGSFARGNCSSSIHAAPSRVVRGCFKRPISPAEEFEHGEVG